jgi:predicted aminopeptidase
VRRWLISHGDAQQRGERLLQERRRLEFLRLIEQTRQRLADLYAKDAQRSELLSRKRAVFQLLQEEYAELKQAWGGYAGYDRWMNRQLNNAHLASINTYHALEPAFRRILNQLDGDMSAFHAACADIGSTPAAERSVIMSDLLRAAENE